MEAVRTRPDIVLEMYMNDICINTVIVDVTLATVLALPPTRDAVRQMGVTIVDPVTNELVAGEGKGVGEVAQAKEMGKIDHGFRLRRSRFTGWRLRREGTHLKGRGS